MKLHVVNQRRLDLFIETCLLAFVSIRLHALSATLTTSLHTTQTSFNGCVWCLADVPLGHTFFLAVVACLLGIIVAIVLVCFAGKAGSGPVHQCCCDTTNSNAMGAARAPTSVRGGGVADFGSLKSQGRADLRGSHHNNEQVAPSQSSAGINPTSAVPAERWASSVEAANNTAAHQKM